MIGILSDSHGRRRAVCKALELFDRRGVSFMIHCGDVGGEVVFEELIGRPCAFVWGNTDEPDDGTLAFLQAVNLPVPKVVPLRLVLEGKRFAVFHGHEREFETSWNSLGVDYVLHGHTHARRDERYGSVRVINPGALHRARPLSVATLDPLTDELTFHEIDP
jgi:hypothetical protein